MQIHLDYRDLLKILNRHKVRYLIVGAYAVTYYTEPRYTKDLDIWIEPEERNAKKAYRALKEFGAPLKNITIKDFTNKKLIYQIGVEPVRVDILMGLQNMKFDFAWKHRCTTTFDKIKVNIIGIKELIKLKKKTKRPIDKMDVESLRYRLKAKK